MRFSIPKDMVINMENNKIAVKGSSSTTGMEICPQLSPATICWNKVNAAAKMVSKPAAHLSHPSKVKRLAMGCKSSTSNHQIRLAFRVRSHF